MTKSSKNTGGRYDDIINLPHHVSKTRPQMPCIQRAAQFAPFAAVTGHKEEIAEAERLTDERKVLDEDAASQLNRKLRFLIDNIEQNPDVQIICFLQDKRKSGGAYISLLGRIRQIDYYRRLIIMQDGRKVPLDDIMDIQAEIFDSAQYF